MHIIFIGHVSRSVVFSWPKDEELDYLKISLRVLKRTKIMDKERKKSLSGSSSYEGFSVCLFSARNMERVNVLTRPELT